MAMGREWWLQKWGRHRLCSRLPQDVPCRLGHKTQTARRQQRLYSFICWEQWLEKSKRVGSSLLQVKRRR